MRAALETGCRYSELARLEVYDFNFDPGTVAIRKSKGGKPGHVILTPEGAEFFQHHCAGRTGSDLMFRHADGSRWNTSEQSRPMKEACEHATIMPRVSFHILRHSWASLAVMAGVPLLVVAENLGHADTRMSRNITGIWHRATSLTPSAPGAPRFGDRASRAESQRLWPHSAGKNAPITSDMQDMRLGDRNPL